MVILKCIKYNYTNDVAFPGADNNLVIPKAGANWLLRMICS